jgi:DNA-binding transcriptional regulator YhcF (GntR family)
MVIKIDFNSDEAIYMQLRNQIVIGIARDQIKAGESLPSVRQLADELGVNMHTVNKAYTILRQEGFVKVDRRRGAFISVTERNRERALNIVEKDLRIILAQARCRGLTKQDMLMLVDRIYDEYDGEN